MASYELRAVEIPPGTALTQPVKKDWHARGEHAFIVHDAVTSTLILASKLTTIAAHLNREFARNRFERVSARGLYEASDNKRGGYSGGLHKMRYLVSKCDLAESHYAFERARQAGVQRATLLSEVQAT